MLGPRLNYSRVVMRRSQQKKLGDDKPNTTVYNLTQKTESAQKRAVAIAGAKAKLITKMSDLYSQAEREINYRNLLQIFHMSEGKVQNLESPPGQLTAKIPCGEQLYQANCLGNHWSHDPTP